MTTILLLFGFCLSFALGLLVIPKILVIAHSKGLYDMPCERKIHHIPIPRLGGFSFFPVVLVSMTLALGFAFYLDISDADDLRLTTEALTEALFLSAGFMLLYLLGIVDDIEGVGYRKKFAVQFIAAGIIPLSGNRISSFAGLFEIYELPFWMSIVFTILLAVFIINAINLIDGVDGLASGLTLLSLVVMGTIFVIGEVYVYALLSICMLGILLPFWWYNFFGEAEKKKKIFMGDTGSLTLGYLLSLLFIHISVIYAEGNIKVEMSHIVMAFSSLVVPVFDELRVILFRLKNRQNPFHADKNHFHHRLIDAGVKPQFVMPVILLFSIGFIVGNYFLLDLAGVTGIFVTNLTVWALIHVYINYLINSNKKSTIESKEIYE